MSGVKTVDMTGANAYPSFYEGISVLIDQTRIHDQTIQLAMALNQDYRGRDLVIVPVMLGGMVFCSDVVRHLSLDAVIDPISIKSYKGTESTGQFKLLLDTQTDLSARDVLVIEDIVDSGRSLKYLREHLGQKGPRTLRFAALLSKPERRIIPIEAEYTCFTIADHFVVGYGLDFDGTYRNLPFVGVLEKGKKG